MSLSWLHHDRQLSGIAFMPEPLEEVPFAQLGKRIALGAL